MLHGKILIFLITDDNISDKEIDFLQKNTTVLVVKTKNINEINFILDID